MAQRLNISRGRIKAVAHTGYRPHPSSTKGVCSYCGVLAETTDHVPPLAVVYMLKDVQKDGRKLWLIPACYECNSILGAFMGETIAERRQFLAEKYSRRYRSVIKMPRWDDDELDELGPMLRTEVRNKQSLGHHVKARMSRLKSKKEKP